jgi:hypothetical protein
MHVVYHARVIPIELPEWLKLAVYVFLALMVADIAALVWFGRRKDKRLAALEEQNAEILAKTQISFMIIKSWNEPRYSENDYYTEEIDKVD